MTAHGWQSQYEARKAAAVRFGPVWRLPLVKKVPHILRAHVPPRARVLDVGAGERRAQEHLPGRVYASLDPDPERAHDYRDLAEVGERFDAVLLLEVVEHLSLPEARELLAGIRRVLVPGGVLLVTTPNTFYPPAYLRDATHRTPFCYDELAGILALSGFDVTHLVRVYNDALPRKVLRRWLLGWLFRALGIDFAPQIAAVARPAP